MRFFDLLGQESDLSRNQRWGHYLTVFFGLFCFVIAINLRDNILYATVEYVNVEAGIRVNYPVGWLIDINGQGYIFRARDVSRIGYKTTLQISTIPLAVGIEARNILDDLSLFRSLRLSNYKILSIQPYTLPDGESATLMEYVFVSDDPNPFLEAVPIVVTGRDILTIRRGQAILITFLADSQTYDADLTIFNRFLSSSDF
ncbi:MAG: hypothetical protein MUF87_06365 [Anaerolineae bacterium]|jgi:hypothetical protein|nr:hypothetical protein [Anaerolineae bacterium]